MSGGTLVASGNALGTQREEHHPWLGASQELGVRDRTEMRAVPVCFSAFYREVGTADLSVLPACSHGQCIPIPDTRFLYLERGRKVTVPPALYRSAPVL